MSIPSTSTFGTVTVTHSDECLIQQDSANLSTSSTSTSTISCTATHSGVSMSQIVDYVAPTIEKCNISNLNVTGTSVNPRPPNEYDFAFFKEKVKGMNKHQMENLVQNIFKPDKSYSFPKPVAGVFVMTGWNNFHGYVIHPSKMVHTVYHVYCLAIVFLGKPVTLKKYFLSR